jgi:hypothetical protein
MALIFRVAHFRRCGRNGRLAADWPQEIAEPDLHFLVDLGQNAPIHVHRRTDRRVTETVLHHPRMRAPAFISDDGVPNYVLVL